jgi:PASTA domain-containing protein
MGRWYLAALFGLLVVLSLVGAGSALAVSHDLAGPRGCRTGGFHDRNTVDPEWVSVMADDVAQVAEGTVRESHVATNDWPYNHDSHDWNFIVGLDGAYQFLHSDSNPVEGGEQRMEMEWEEKYFPIGFRPAVGDRFWVLGRWIFDCGHQPYRTEIHPPKAVAFTRSAPAFLAGDNHASSANKTFVYIHGRGGYYDTSVAQQDYDFDIPMPPKPPGRSNAPPAMASPRVIGNCQVTACTVPRAVVQSTVGGVTPTLTFVPAADPTHVHVHYPLQAVADASPNREFASTIVTAWQQNVPTVKFRRLCVSFDSIKVLDDHDTASGEWRLRLYDGAEWILPPLAARNALDDVDNGQVVNLRDPHDHRRCQEIVNVPKSGSIRIGAGGWESDPIDDLIDDHSGNALKLLDENDNIGFLNHSFSAAENFGTDAPHDSLSRPTDDDEHFGSDTAPGPGGRDYLLRYRITELPADGTSPPRATVPDVRESRPAAAENSVRAAKLVPKFTGANPSSKTYVATQSPPAGTSVDRGSTVTMFLRTGPLP